MIYWSEYEGHKPDILGKRKKFDNTIYTFDIETTTYIKINNKIYPGITYKDLTEEKKEKFESGAFMYIWQFSINDKVYYGRKWSEFRSFLKLIDEDTDYIPKVIYVHNLAFEFQFLRNEFEFKEVLARTSHKVMRCKFEEFNFELKCSLILSNCPLKLLPKLFKLESEKMVGDLDYNLIRNTYTKLSAEELKYCENDCLVLYEYIKRELETYKTINKIPLTSTGKVRTELKEKIQKDVIYKRKIKKAINTNPHIFNLLQEAFAGRLYTFKCNIYI